VNFALHIPGPVTNEARWVAEVVFGEWLGVEHKIVESDGIYYRLEAGGKSIEWPDHLFQSCDTSWLTEDNLPLLPLQEWNVLEYDLDLPLIDAALPVLYGAPSFELNSTGIRLGVDMFGTFFFLLTNFEAVILKDRDEHDRFPAQASIAYKADYLHRPLADEYLDLLWACMKYHWPAIQRKPTGGLTHVTCDVDQVYSPYVRSWWHASRVLAGALIKRHSLSEFKTKLKNKVATQFEDYRFEPYNTFDWIMDVNESAGNKVTFFFQAGHSVPSMDGDYDVNEARIRSLLHRIHERGHEIGLHPSYGTYQNGLRLNEEADCLRNSLLEEQIFQQDIGSRQHYLRWDVLQTNGLLEKTNITYDTTLGYADHPGFRCGTSHEYPMFDLKSRSALKLRQRPLILMECSVIQENYMDLGETDAAFEVMNNLKGACQKFGGNFTFLWHNNSLASRDAMDMYVALLN